MRALFWFEMLCRSKHWDWQRRSVAYVFLARSNFLGVRIAIRGALHDESSEARICARLALRRLTPRRLAKIAKTVSGIDVEHLLDAVYSSNPNYSQGRPDPGMDDDVDGAGIPVRPRTPARGPGNESEIPPLGSIDDL